MFKLPNLPSQEADREEMADFAELLSWTRGTVSAREIIAFLGRLDDNDDNSGCDDDDDANDAFLDEVMNEVDRRSSACGSGYPFRLAREGTIVTHNSEDNTACAWLYRFLLMTTRINMQTSREFDGIDGTLLFEEIASEVLRIYLGGIRAQSCVFGTAVGGSFEAKVNSLCKVLGEGGEFRSLGTGDVTAKDGKLDVVAWVPFSDGLPGKLILFGQCKTGTHWDSQITQLRPEAFIKKWMRDPVVVDPMRVFCVAEARDLNRTEALSCDAGIFLDRCRLVDFCGSLSDALIIRMRVWTTAAKKRLGTNLDDMEKTRRPCRRRARH